MPRPPSDNPASDLIRARCTPEQKAEIRKRALAAGMSLSAYVLACALGVKP